MLRKFKLKIYIESMLKNILFSTAVSAVAESLFMLATKLIPFNASIIMHLLVISSIFLISFIIKTIYNFPRESSIARRVDADAKLDERLATMVQFKKEEGPMVDLQRTDAIEHLEKTTAKSVKWHFTLANFMLAIIAAPLLVVSAVAPIRTTNVLADENEVDKDEYVDWIERIIEKIDSSGISNQIKEETTDVLTDLQEEVYTAEEDAKIIDYIEASKEKVDTVFDVYTISARKILGDALQEHLSTAALGEKVVDGSSSEIKTELLACQLSLTASGNLLGDLNSFMSDLNDSLNTAYEKGIDENYLLYQALTDLATKLAEIDQSESKAKIIAAIDKAFEDVLNGSMDKALKEQEELVELKDYVDEELNNMINRLEIQLGKQDGQGNGDGEGDGEGEGDGDGSGRTNKEMPDGDPGGDGASGGHKETVYASDAQVYNPSTGEYVSYGEALAQYYKYAEDAEAEGRIPEDVAYWIQKYFASLYSPTTDDNVNNHDNNEED